MRQDPIQAVPVVKVARTGHFSTYKSHTSHILHAGPHIFHRTRRVSYHFLPAEFGPLVCLNAVGPRLLRVQARWPVCPRPARRVGRCDLGIECVDANLLR